MGTKEGRERGRSWKPVERKKRIEINRWTNLIKKRKEEEKEKERNPSKDKCQKSLEGRTQKAGSGKEVGGTEAWYAPGIQVDATCMGTRYTCTRNEH